MHDTWLSFLRHKSTYTCILLRTHFRLCGKSLLVASICFLFCVKVQKAQSFFVTVNHLKIHGVRQDVSAFCTFVKILGSSVEYANIVDIKPCLPYENVSVCILDEVTL